MGEWKDFGLPGDYESAAEQIRQGFLRAKRGERVEIGCIGGLGRTGTALACRHVAQLRKIVESLRRGGGHVETRSGWMVVPGRFRQGLRCLFILSEAFFSKEDQNE